MNNLSFCFLWSDLLHFRTLTLGAGTIAVLADLIQETAVLSSGTLSEAVLAVLRVLARAGVDTGTAALARRTVFVAGGTHLGS